MRHSPMTWRNLSGWVEPDRASRSRSCEVTTLMPYSLSIRSVSRSRPPFSWKTLKSRSIPSMSRPGRTRSDWKPGRGRSTGKSESRPQSRTECKMSGMPMDWNWGRFRSRMSVSAASGISDAKVTRGGKSSGTSRPTPTRRARASGGDGRSPVESRRRNPKERHNAATAAATKARERRWRDMFRGPQRAAAFAFSAVQRSQTRYA